MASQVAAYEADKARLAEERQTLERVMTEKLARAQAERERAEKGVATETARLPVYALEQSRNDGTAAGTGGTAAARGGELPGESTPGPARRPFRERSRCAAKLPMIAIGNWMSNRFIWAGSQLMDKTFANWRRCVTHLARR